MCLDENVPQDLDKQNPIKDANIKSKENTKAAEKMKNWFSLFAELDPLANPDSLGKKDTDKDNC